MCIVELQAEQIYGFKVSSVTSLLGNLRKIILNSLHHNLLILAHYCFSDILDMQITFPYLLPIENNLLICHFFWDKN